MKAYAILAAALLTTACGQSNTEKNFLCGAQTGQPCRTMSEVDGGGAVGGGSLAETAQDAQNAQLTQPILTGGKSGSAVAGVPAGGAPYQSARYRIPEKTGRLWLPPYLDENQILHEGTYVHFVVREASWGTR